MEITATAAIMAVDQDRDEEEEEDMEEITDETGTGTVTAIAVVIEETGRVLNINSLSAHTTHELPSVPFSPPNANEPQSSLVFHPTRIRQYGNSVR